MPLDYYIIGWRKRNLKITEGIIETNFLVIPDETKYWFVRASQKAEYYTDFKYNNFIAVGDNEVKLKKLMLIEDKLTATPSTHKEEYKRIFNEQYVSLLMNSPKYKESAKSEQADQLEKTKRSSTVSANKTYSFVEEMDIGDYVLVPYKRSEVFLIGIVLSDVFDSPIDHEYFGKDLDYPISDYEKKRRVLWIKEIDQNELPESLSWIRTGQRAIFDISGNANDINPVISNEFIYKGNAHIRAHVGTKQKVSSSTWLQYQLLINENADGKADEVYQKNKVQSEGHTILEAIVSNWETIALVGAALFTEVDYDIKGIKFKAHGPLSFLVPGSKQRKEREAKRADLELLKQKEELTGLELDNEAKAIQNEKEKIALEELKNRSELFTQTENYKEDSNKAISRTPEQLESLQDMRVSQKVIGSEISPQRQTVIQNLLNFESEEDQMSELTIEQEQLDN